MIVDQPAVCYLLSIARLKALAGDYPVIQSRLILNIGRELVARLRRADGEIRTLAE